MGALSKIEWTDHTFNPWIGCAKVSPGCAHCYAAAQDKFRKWTPEGWGAGKPRRLASEAMWKNPVKWNREAEAFPEYSRPRVFCASLADWLDDEVPVEWLARLLQLIHDTPHLDWLLLTKRPQNWRARIEATALAAAPDLCGRLCGWLAGAPRPNVWIGTTVEDQVRADERIPELLKIPAKVRFLSCEPLLGAVDLRFVSSKLRRIEPSEHIHWVICGGESGPGARPMHPDWARSLRDQCAAAGVPFFFKQWGEFSDAFSAQRGRFVCSLTGESTDDLRKWDHRRCAGKHFLMPRIGKKAAGRLLDGGEHNAFPSLTPQA